MNEVIILPPSDDLIEAVAARLPSGTNDLSNAVVVFPGKRPGHFLRKEVARRLGSACFPPRVYSIDAFMEFVLTELLNIRKPLLPALDALAILHDVHLAMHHKVGDTSYNSLDAFLPLGSRLLSELEEVHLSHLPDSRVNEVLAGVPFPKFESLARYYCQFYREVERRGLFTRSLMYRTVAERMNDVDVSHFSVMIFAGFYAFTRTEREIVKALHGRANVTFIFQQGVGLQEQLLQLGVSTPVTAHPARAGAKLHFVKALDTHGQVFSLAAHIQERVTAGETLDHRTAIVLPSPDALFPVVHYALPSLDEGDYNIALGYPLARTPVYGFLNSLMDLVGSMQNGRLSSAQYLTFVLHPYTKNIRFGQRSDVTRMFFHALETHLLTGRAKLAFRLEDLENDTDLFRDAAQRLSGTASGITPDELRHHLVTIHSQTMRRLLDFRSVAGFAEAVIDILSYIAENSTANLHPFFRPYVQRLMEVFDALRSSLLADRTFSEPLACFAFIRALVAGETVPFSGTPLHGVQVLGLLETRNLKFDTLYLLDATDDIIPGSRGSDVLLPQPVRALLGLETYRDREKLMEYHVELAVRSAWNVYLFYTETGKTEKSRYVQKLLWQQQQQDRRGNPDSYEQVVRYRVKLTNVRPEAIVKTQEVIDFIRQQIRFSAHSLDTYLACQRKFYFQNVLRLRERDEASDEMESADVGSLVHSVLAKYFEPTLGLRLTPPMLTRERLERVIDTCFREKFGPDVTGPLLLMKRQILKRLSHFIERYQRPLVEREEVVMIGLEKKLEAEKNGYRFTGRIDRIEMRGRSCVILDYKTGKGDAQIRLDRLTDERRSWPEAIKSFQLPLYMLLYSGQAHHWKENLIPAFLVLGKNLLDENIEIGMADEGQNPADVYGRVEPLLFRLIDEIADPVKPFESTGDLATHCPRCPYSAICGTQWVR